MSLTLPPFARLVAANVKPSLGKTTSACLAWPRAKWASRCEISIISRRSASVPTDESDSNSLWLAHSQCRTHQLKIQQEPARELLVSFFSSCDVANPPNDALW